MKLHPQMLDPERRRAPRIDIEKVIEKYGGHYVGDFPGKTKYGWSDGGAVAVFYRADPAPPHTNRYFGFYMNPYDVLVITNADYVEGVPFTALSFDDGIVYSTCRHDYRTEGRYSIDGGWDYINARGGPLITVEVRDGEFVKLSD